MADTTVYSIFAGYVPQMGFSKDDFEQARAQGTKRTYTQGDRFDGDSRKLSSIQAGLHTDGRLGAARVRGSVAWYEFSTRVRDVKIAVADGGEEQEAESKRLASAWHTGNRSEGATKWKNLDNANKKLLNAFEEIIGFENLQPTGEFIKGADKAEAEEQAVGPGSKGGKGRALWKESDPELREQDRIFGANAIDVYLRGSDGKIYRLDITAQTMDDKSAHHGLTSWEDRDAAGVTGQKLFKTIQKDGIDKAREDLLTYFERVRKDVWNPPIIAMKDIIRTNQLTGSQMLADLESGKESLEKITAEAKRKLKELIPQLRGKGVKGQGVKRQDSGDVGKGGKKIYEMAESGKDTTGRGGWQSAANAIRKWYATEASAIARGAPSKFASIGTGKLLGRDSKGIGGGEAFNSGLEFALHMMGNVLELFRGDSARKGGYSTAYTMGSGSGPKGGRAPGSANFVVEVQHSIHPSGSSVFEFMKMSLNDIHIHSEAALTTAYQKQLWYEGKKNQQALVIANAIRQNQLAALNSMGDGVSTIEIGASTYIASETLAAKGGTPMHMASGTAKVIPQIVNDTIDDWLQQALMPRKTTDAKTSISNVLRQHTYQFAHSDDYRRQQGALRANKGEDPSVQTGREMRRGLPGTQSILSVDPLGGSASGGNLFPWVELVRRSGGFGTGTGIKKNERVLQARMGLEGQNKEYSNLRKFIQDKDSRGMAKAMGTGSSAGKWKRSSVKRQELSFWATPYLSVLYPSTQVRVK